MVRKLVLTLVLAVATLAGCAGSGQSFVATGVVSSDPFESSKYSPL